jgi:hypothetical protein
MTARWRIALWLCLPLAAMAKLPPIECPAGTFRRDIPFKTQWSTQSCIDGHTREREGPHRYLRPNGTVALEYQYRQGKKQGVSRSYTEAEELEYEIDFENDNEVGRRLAPAGLREIMDMSNAERERDGKPGHFEVIDDHTIRLTFEWIEPLPDPMPDLNVMIGQLIEQQGTCVLFHIQGARIERLITRVMTESGKFMFEVVIPASRCAVAIAPAAK